MLKRIDPRDVTLGMYIEKLEGNWFKHPFWKSQFILDDPKRLDDLIHSAVDAVIIDVSKGASPDTDERPHRNLVSDRSLPQAPDVVASTPPTRSGLKPARSAHTLAAVREFGKAKSIATRTEKSVSKLFLECRLGKAIEAESVEPIIDEVFKSLQRSPHAFGGLMRCKSGVPSIYTHSVAVSALMISLAMRMRWEPQNIRVAGMAGLLMDIGHSQMDQVDDKGGVTADPIGTQEARHVVVGHEILKATEGLPEEILSVCLHHHERLDGTGFPMGLSGDQIDELSRMAAICDRFDTLASLEESGRMLDPATALRQLLDEETGLDAKILNAFFESMGVYPVGSMIELQSGRLAMVVFGDPDGEDLPTVRPFFDLAQNRTIRCDNIDLRNCFGEDRIVRTRSLDDIEIADPETLRHRLLDAAIRAEAKVDA